MKILLVHNTYQHKGGEDSVFENEYQLLKNNHHQVAKLLFSNDNIHSVLDKLKVGISSICNTRSGKIFQQKIIEFQPDIIHVHNFFPIASPALFYVANKLNIPIVMTLHNYRLICPNALLFRANEICEKCIQKSFAIDGVINGCYRDSKIQTFALALMSYIHKKKNTWNTKVDQYIPLTNFAKQKILSSSLGLQQNQLTVKPNFVEDFGFDYEKEDYFLFVGRLSIEKGIDLLLEVFGKNNKKLIIIGTGPLENQVKKASITHPNIIYVGFQQKDFIIQKLKKAKALIFSSVWYETFGLTIIEALSTATPVIAPNIGSPNEIIQDTINGLIYQVGDANSIQKGIETILENKEKYKQLCIHARKSYEDFYTPEKNYQDLLQIYKNAVSIIKK